MIKIEASAKEKINLLADAIKKRLVVAFNYPDEKHHVAEPFTLGVHKDTGKYVLRCYKSFPPAVSDNPESWKLYEVDKIYNLELMPVIAQNLRIGYDAADRDMSQIISYTANHT